MTASPAFVPSQNVDDAARIRAMLQLVSDRVPLQRRLLHAGDLVHATGMAFTQLFVLRTGLLKIVSSSADGRDQVVGLHFGGDWLGFDGIASGRHTCETVALDTGEIWALRYDTLMQASSLHRPLLDAVHAEMSRAITRSRSAILSLCTLSAPERVAEFLLYWAESLQGRGQRIDAFTLRMTRAEIGNYLGMTLESVSRALSGLARHKMIGFSENGRREIRIPDLRALAGFVDGSGPPPGVMVQ